MNIFIIVFSVVLNAFAQIFIKTGMSKVGDVTSIPLSQTLVNTITNIHLWFAMSLYGVSVLLWMYVLSKNEVSYAYPFLSIGYVVTAFLGYYIFSENLSLIRISGIAVICVGVYLISRS